MEKIKFFFETYFKQIGSCILTLAFAVLLVLGSIEPLGIYRFSVSSLSALLLFSVIFVLNAATCSLVCKKTADLQQMRIIVLFCTLGIYTIFFIVYTLTAPVFESEQAACIVAMGVLSCLISDGVVQARWERLLKDEDPRAYTLLLVRDGRMLSEQQQMILLDDSKLESWLYRYIQNHYLCAKAEERLFSQSHNDNIWAEYIKRYNLNPETQPWLFRMPDANKWVRLYLEAHGSLTDASVQKVFHLSEAPKLMEIYINQGVMLSDAAEMQLFDLPNGEALYCLYRQKYIPCDEAELKAKKLGWI